MLFAASFLTGDLELAYEFYMKARDHLTDVFDTFDYDVATVLLHLGWWGRFYSKVRL